MWADRTGSQVYLTLFARGFKIDLTEHCLIDTHLAGCQKKPHRIGRCVEYDSTPMHPQRQYPDSVVVFLTLRPHLAPTKENPNARFSLPWFAG